MRTTTALTLGNAAKATGKNKTTILRAIQNGKISATKDAEGQWQIEPVELFRHFSTVPDETPAAATPAPLSTPPETGAATPLVDELRRQLERLEAERERERREHREALERERETAADLRRRLDASEEERRRKDEQVKLLTDQRQQGQEGARREEVEALRREFDELRQQQEIANRTNKRRGWLARMFGGS